ncbi:hypothetical protein Hokovirus_4_27 [Hokovirus HKV1]|uniref:Uncharacterized protein n=1 Tax=Hokovirus HKV1 TaxID=1977638 RepID=A0A1V0SH70_9VIRU|nr:hypothetical protein Hokovirus_4_27 [Hokovirus HKV1]
MIVQNYKLYNKFNYYKISDEQIIEKLLMKTINYIILSDNYDLIPYCIINNNYYCYDINQKKIISKNNSNECEKYNTIFTTLIYEIDQIFISKNNYYNKNDVGYNYSDVINFNYINNNNTNNNNNRNNNKNNDDNNNDNDYNNTNNNNNNNNDNDNNDDIEDDEIIDIENIEEEINNIMACYEDYQKGITELKKIYSEQMDKCLQVKSKKLKIKNLIKKYKEQDEEKRNIFLCDIEIYKKMKNELINNKITMEFIQGSIFGKKFKIFEKMENDISIDNYEEFCRLLDEEEKHNMFVNDSI